MAPSRGAGRDRWWRRALACVPAVVFALSGPGSSPASAEEPAAEKTVTIGHGAFEPRVLEVVAGTKVTWIHQDGEDAHSVTADDGSFDSHPHCTEAKPKRCMNYGERYSNVFATAGSFAYHSRTEGGPGGQGASGVIEVTAH